MSKAEEIVKKFVDRSKTTPGQHTIFELAEIAYEAGRLAGLEEAADIAEKFEPTEKQDYIKYASTEIRALAGKEVGEG